MSFNVVVYDYHFKRQNKSKLSTLKRSKLFVFDFMLWLHIAKTILIEQ
jgi:hypothetical protein